MSIHIDIPVPEFGHPAELAMIERLRGHGPELVQQYLATYTTDGVLYVARDAAKRIFPEYNVDRTANNRYSDQAASALADAARRIVLNRRPMRQKDLILIVTGTPASGKTVASREASASRLEMVHETIILSHEKAAAAITQALVSSRRVAIHLFYTNDPGLHVRRMIARARGIGRTVPLAYMAKAFSSVPQSVLRLSELFREELQIFVTNNSWTPAEAEQHDNLAKALGDTEAYTEGRCLEMMDHELTEIHRETPIPASILNEARLR